MTHEQPPTVVDVDSQVQSAPDAILTTDVVAATTPDSANALPVFEKIGLQTHCESDSCFIKVVATYNGLQVETPDLPFSAQSDDVWEQDADESFGLGEIDARKLQVWMVGEEEHSTGVAVETAMFDGVPALLVHQTIGYEHVKRVHVVYFASAGKLEELVKIQEGAGNELTELWPVAGGVAVRRQLPGQKSAPKPTVYQVRRDQDKVRLQKLN